MMGTDTWTVAEAIASFLRSRRLTRVYGLTGGEVNDLIDAIELAGIHFMLTHHESSAAHMADAEAQLAGRPSVCIATVGPGATNMVNGVANAYLDRTPLLALIGDMEARVRDSWTHMTLDLVGLFSPVSKFAKRITGKNIYSVLPEAWATAMAGPQGPVCLMLAATDAGDRIQRREWTYRATCKLSDAGNGNSVARQILHRIARAKNPVLMLGLGARTQDIATASLDFANKSRIPVALTPKAKGSFPADSELYAGVYASYGSGGVEHLLSTSDLIIGVGLDGSDFIRPWRFGSVLSLSHNAKADTAYPSEHHLCNISKTLGELSEYSWGIRDGSIDASVARTESTRQICGRDLHEKVGKPLTKHGIDPVSAVAAVRGSVPSDTLLTCDVGMLKLVLCQYWPSYQLNTFLVSNGLSTMGYGLPAAISASLYLENSPVVAMLGDGGLLMCLGELETLARSGAVVVAIVAVDSSLGLIRLKAEDASLCATPNDFGHPDYVRIAQSFALEGIRVESIVELAATTTSALSNTRSTLIELPIDFDGYRRMT